MIGFKQFLLENFVVNEDDITTNTSIGEYTFAQDKTEGGEQIYLLGTIRGTFEYFEDITDKLKTSYKRNYKSYKVFKKGEFVGYQTHNAIGIIKTRASLNVNFYDKDVVLFEPQPKEKYKKFIETRDNRLKTRVRNAFVNWKNAGYDNIKEMIIDGKRYDIVNCGNSDKVYAFSYSTNTFENVNIKQLKELRYDDKTDEYFSDDEDSLFYHDGNKISFTDITKETTKYQGRVKRWKDKEKAIADNLNKIFKSDNFTVDGKTPNEQYHADVVGGPSQSDIEITSDSTKKSFFIESKLNYTTGEYFKFELSLSDGQLTYTPSNSFSEQQKTSLNVIFGNSSTETDSLLGKFLSNQAIEQDIKDFYDNIFLFLKQTSKFINTSSQNKLVDELKKQFFGGVEILTDVDNEKIKKMVFPKDLIPILQCFAGYLNFVVSLDDSKKSARGPKSKRQQLYDQLIENLNSLNNGKNGDVEQFIDKYKSIKSQTAADLYRFLFTNICSSVESKSRVGKNVLKLCSIQLPNSDWVVDKINDYYTKVHNCKYIEIGTNRFKNGVEFNQNTWHSSIYVLTHNSNDIIDDPFNLIKKYNKKVKTLSDMEKLQSNIFIGVGDACTSFDFKLFIGDANLEYGVDDERRDDGISFEELEEINMKQEF